MPMPEEQAASHAAPSGMDTEETPSQGQGAQ